MKEAEIKLRPITPDMLPKSIEQQMLASLLRIEKLLEQQLEQSVKPHHSKRGK